MEKYIIGNLKMNLLTVAERNHYLASFSTELKKSKFENSKIVLCPPFIHLEKFSGVFGGTQAEIGVQDIYFEERGSFTGEISPTMVKNFGGYYSIIGHSERRRYFGETNEIANEKIKIALKNGLRPIYCLGETEDERRRDLTFDVIAKQIKEAFLGIANTQADKIIIAYEPIWAVGTDAIPESNEIMEVKIWIRKMLSELYSQDIAEKIPVLYGGSVKVKSVKQACIDPGMDGVLVGRESLVPMEFLKVANIIDKS